MSILEKVIEIVAKTCEVDKSEVTGDSTVGDFPAWDSMGHLAILSAVEEAFDASQISQNSHLMVCDKLINEFPGRQFLVDEVIPFKDKDVKQLQKRVKQANITTRNFRLKADALRKRLGINDGGDIYIFATTLSSGQQVLILSKKVI